MGQFGLYSNLCNQAYPSLVRHHNMGDQLELKDGDPWDYIEGGVDFTEYSLAGTCFTEVECPSLLSSTHSIEIFVQLG